MSCKRTRGVCGKEECENCRPRSCASHERMRECWSEKNKEKLWEITYGSSTKKYWFICKECNHEFSSSPAVISSGHWCPYCGGQKLCNDDNCKYCFEKSCASREKMLNSWSIKNKFSPREIAKSSGNKCLFNCDSCGHEFSSSPAVISSGHWCPYCGGQKLCNDDNCKYCFEKSCASHEKMSKYWSRKNKLTARECSKGSNVKFWFVCNKCEHEFDSTPNDISRTDGKSTWCPFCVNKTEMKLGDFLREKLDIKDQARFEWCGNKKYRFDFHIKSMALIIELDGPQHFRQVSNWTPPEETQANDRIKEEKAMENGYHLLRLSQEDIFNDGYNWKEFLTDFIDGLEGKPSIHYCPKYPEEFRIKITES